MKKISLIILILCLLSAQDAIPFLSQSMQASSNANGFAYLSSDSSAQEFVPALLEKKSSLLFAKQFFYSDINNSMIAFSSYIGNYKLGVVFRNQVINNLELRDAPSSEPIGNFETLNSDLSFSLSRTILMDNLNIALNFHNLRSKIYASDVSSNSLDLSLAFTKNSLRTYFLLNSFYLSNESVLDKKFKNLISLGADYQLSEFIVGFEFHENAGYNSTYHFKANYIFSNDFKLLTGYILKSDFYSATFGASYRYNKIILNYAYVPNTYLSSLQSISFAYEL